MSGLQKDTWYGFVSVEEYNALDAARGDPIVDQLLAGLTYSKKGVYYYTATPFDSPWDNEADEETGDTWLDHLLELGLPMHGYTGRYIWSTQGVEGLW